MTTQQSGINSVGQALSQRVPCSRKAQRPMCKPCQRVTEELLKPLDRDDLMAFLERQPRCQALQNPSLLSRMWRWLTRR